MYHNFKFRGNRTQFLLIKNGNPTKMAAKIKLATPNLKIRIQQAKLTILHAHM